LLAKDNPEFLYTRTLSLKKKHLFQILEPVVREVHRSAQREAVAHETLRVKFTTFEEAKGMSFEGRIDKRIPHLTIPLPRTSRDYYPRAALEEFKQNTAKTNLALRKVRANGHKGSGGVIENWDVS